MSGRYSLPVLVAALIVQSPAQSQDYIPMAKPADETEAKSAIGGLIDLGESLGRLASPVDSGSNSVDPAPSADPFTCTTPPQLSELATKINTTSMALSSAAKLGLPVGGVGMSTNGRVLVQDWTRSKPCLSTDGQTKLLYGQAARIVASISEIDANTDLTFATIAAQATLNRKASSVQAELIGIDNDEAQQEAATLLGPLDVENFADKSAVAEKLAQLALATPSGKAEFLGVVQDAPDLNLQVAAAYAVQQVASRRSCMDARQRLRDATVPVIGTIEGVYVSLMGTCDSTQPSAVAKATAEAALMGLKVKD